MKQTPEGLHHHGRNAALGRERSPEEKRLTEVKSQIDKIHFEDGISIPLPLDYDPFAKDPTKPVRTKLGVVEVQLKNMQDAVCRAVSPVVVARLCIDPKTHQPIPRNDIEARFKMVKQYLAQENKKSLALGKQKGVYLPMFDMETEQPLSVGSLKLFRAFAYQFIDPASPTEDQIKTLLDRRRSLLQTYQVDDARSIYNSDASMIEQLDSQVDIITTHVIRQMALELQGTAGDLGIDPKKPNSLGLQERAALLESNFAAKIDQAIEGFREEGYYVSEFDPSTGEAYPRGSLEQLVLAKKIRAGHVLSPEEISKDRGLILKRVTESAASSRVFQRGEVFDPDEEFARTMSLPKGQRKEAIGIFKVKLIRQLTGLAQMREVITRQLTTNPGMPTPEFNKIVNTYKEIFAFSNKQIAQVTNVWHEYIDACLNIIDIQGAYPQRNNLIKDLFRRNISANIAYDSMAVIVTVNNQADFSRAAYAYYEAKGGVITPQMFAREKDVAGRVLGKVLLPVLNEQVVLINGRENATKSILAHERQHIINSFFNRATSVQRNDLMSAIATQVHFSKREGSSKLQQWIQKLPLFASGSALRSEVQSNGVLTMVRHHLLGYQRVALDKAKDEILAYFLSQHCSPQDVIATMVDRKETALYDYLAEDRVKAVKELVEVLGEDKRGVIESQVKDVLESDYDQQIKDATNATQQLKGLGFSTQQVIALLTQYPAYQWPKVVRRFAQLEEYNKL